MGKRYDQHGEAQARAVLLDLASSPATAKHSSTKLARHFAGDDPPPALVDRLARAYLSSGGDLPAVYRTLIELPEPWAPKPLKFKSPWEWSVSALRAVGTRQLEPKTAAACSGSLGSRPGSRDRPPVGTTSLKAGRDLTHSFVESRSRSGSATNPAQPIDARALAEKLSQGC